MDKTFERFANEIKFKISPHFQNIKLVGAVLDHKDNVFTLKFQSLAIIPFEEMYEFLLCVNQNFKYKTKMEFEVSSPIFEFENIKQYLMWIIRDFLKQKSLIALLNNESNFLQHKKWLIETSSEFKKKQLDALLPDIARIMHKFGFDDFQIDTKYVNFNTEALAKEKEAFISSAAQTVASRLTKSAATVKTSRYASGFVELTIEELATAEEKNVHITGVIFSLEHKTTKTELIITEMAITNYQDAVSIKIFSRNADDFKNNNQFKIGDKIGVQGEYQIDTYTKEPVVIARKIKALDDVKHVRHDNAEKKRIEFGLRTRMSTMDGVVSAADYVEQIKKWHHSGLAIVDSESVQAFPELHSAIKKTTIKAMYGSTFNTVSKYHRGVLGVRKHQDLATDTYVVFDLETTGLSPVYDDIIEFGAIKITNNQITDSRQFFIKPNKAISPKITELTGITEEMISKKHYDLKTALKEITTFFGAATLVAHNASFDINFINQKLSSINHAELSNPVVDTMIVGRIVHSEASRFRLENLAVRYGFSYDSTTAHRADYDSELLSRIWMKMIIDLNNLNIKTQSDLQSYHSSALTSKAFKKEVTLLAKNQAGLKELFKKISLSHTDQHFGQPTLFFEDLSKRENLLMGSGALKGRLVEVLYNGTDRQLDEEVQNYDYIEIQAPRNFVQYLTKGYAQHDIEDAIKRAIAAAKKHHKLIVVTGDVRYIEKEEKIYHEVYINAKGLGGVRHYLFDYDVNNQVYPTQNLLTTDEMLAEFAFLKDKDLAYEIVVENTHKLSAQISKVEVIKNGLFAPTMKDADENLEKLVLKNAKKKYGEHLPKEINDRITKELTPIKKYNFSVVYWIAHLLVNKSLNEGYLVGSRGSVGSSLVATLSDITEVNPLPPHYVCHKCKTTIFPKVHLNSGYDLEPKTCEICHIPFAKEGQNIPFETFLGFNADKTPDIDLNFSGEYQPIIHAEVRKLFGESHTFRAGTISTVAEKTAFGYVSNWAESTNKKISRSFTNFIVKNVAGTKRTTGQHPGGIIVVPKDYEIEDFSPINYPADDVDAGWKTTHFDFSAIHDNVLKLDLLGHDDPTAIKMLEELTGINVKTQVPFSDEKVISLFSSTTALGIKPEDINNEAVGVMGIPEFGTKFVRGMLRKARVNSFGDLIAISGLSHGTNVWATNAEILVSRLGKSLNEVISCRDDIMTGLIDKNIEPIVAFEIMEQVRKGKSITITQEELLKKHGVENWYIDSLKKIKYMFPKAHATAYVMMAWRIAWFKVYYPLAFYATFLTTRADVFDLETVISGKDAVIKKLKSLEALPKPTTKEAELIPILEIVNEAYARGIKFAGLDLKRSDARRWVMDIGSNTLYPPFIALDGLGFAVADSIIRARQEKMFSSLDDFKKRTQTNNTLFEKMKSLKVFKGLDSSDQLTLDLFTFA